MFVASLCLYTSAHAAASESFATPQEALQALEKACQHNSTRTLLKILGAEGKDVIESGDKREDKHERQIFAKMVEEKYTLTPSAEDANKMIIMVGNNGWPFPIPLQKTTDNRWQFDAAEGRQEILARRIGHNELIAIEVCQGYVEAQDDYAQTHHNAKGLPEYAQKIVSTPGKEDGLYWECTTKDQQPCTVPSGFAKAATRMAVAQREPYHGYYYRILTAQGPAARGGAVDYVIDNSMIGGFGLIAWPAEYGVSGIKTFLVNHDGTVFEQDLGPDTTKQAEAITEFNPDSSWKTIQPE